MFIGKVTGTVVATRKHERLVGSKLLIITPVDKNLEPQAERRMVAVDHLGAGLSELVLVATGSAARIGYGNDQCPVDALVVGIIDSPDKIVSV